MLREQLRGRLPDSLARASERILSSLEQGKLSDSVPAALQILYRPSVQPYLISWFKYDPSEVVHALKVPVLIAYGTTDLQVDTADAVALERGLRGGKCLRVDGMNHVLKLGWCMSERVACSGCAVR